MSRGRLFAACAAVFLCADPGAAQVSVADPGLRGSTHFGAGYVVSLPRQMFGLHAVIMSPGLRNWGAYADFKRTSDRVADDELFEPGITVEQALGFNDFPMTEQSDWETFNVAIVRVLSPGLAVYGGAGRSEETAYRRFLDETETRGTGGIYWAEDPRTSGTRLNVLGGAFFRAHRNVLFHFGAESQPTGATVGATLVLPFFR